MIRVLILVEGQTEETFVRELISPYLAERGIYVSSPIVTTGKVKKGPIFKGGIVSYRRVKDDVIRLLRSDKTATLVTTMIDFYGLPMDFPGKDSLPLGSCFDRCTYIEQEMRDDIKDSRFDPYLSLHEFEALLYVDPANVARAFPDSNILQPLMRIRQNYSSPEEIDDHPETAPSKRLGRLIPEYIKTLHGPLITSRIGLLKIRSECSHFDGWMRKLERLSEEN